MITPTIIVNLNVNLNVKWEVFSAYAGHPRHERKVWKKLSFLVAL